MCRSALPFDPFFYSSIMNCIILDSCIIWFTSECPSIMKSSNISNDMTNGVGKFVDRRKREELRRLLIFFYSFFNYSSQIMLFQR